MKRDVVRDGRHLMENDYGVDSCYLPGLGEWVSVPNRRFGRVPGPIVSVAVAKAVDDALMRRAADHPNYRYQAQRIGEEGV